VATVGSRLCARDEAGTCWSAWAQPRGEIDERHRVGMSRLEASQECIEADVGVVEAAGDDAEVDRHDVNAANTNATRPRTTVLIAKQADRSHSHALPTAEENVIARADRPREPELNGRTDGSLSTCGAAERVG
jgi:hypothetical protein